MKKIILLTLLIGSISFSAELPTEVEKGIFNSTKSLQGGERIQEINWQKESYFIVQKELEKAPLTQEQKDKILKNLKGAYGYNYVMQAKKLDKEIEFYTTIDKNVDKKVEEYISKQKIEEIGKEKNLIAKEEINKINQNTVVPKEIMVQIDKEAEILYPGNFYEQKRYIESSIKNFEFIKNYLKK